MTSVETLDSLPEGMTRLELAATAEGFGMLQRLIHEFASGENRFDQPGEKLLGAFDGAKILIGICGLNRDPFTKETERTGRVRRLYVHPEHRRIGVAGALLDGVQAAAAGAFDLLSAFTEDNTAAIFYESRGFVRVEGVQKRSHQLTLLS